MKDFTKKKIAIFISEIMWTTHLGTGLEIIQNHLDAGDHVKQFVCNSFLHVCDQNTGASPGICSLCMHKRNKAVSLLSDKIELVEINFPDINYDYLNPEMNLNGLKKIEHGGFDVGMAAASSLISLTRDASISVHANFALLNELINKSCGLYDFFIAKLTQEKQDIVYVFNGRLIYDRALLRACEHLKINYRIFDGAYDVNKYSLIENAMLHDIKDFEKRASDLWEKSEKKDEEKYKLGETFYLNSRYGSSKMRAFYAEKQQDELLPESWNDSLNNIVCFLSSEDEFAAIGDQWVMDLYTNQVDGLNKISASLQDYPATRLFIRIHPNSFNTNPSFIDSIYSLASEKVFIIPPDSPISSYTLMLKSDKVLTFGSSVGIEASFWSKPSINLGKSFYMNMGVAYNPRTHDEVIKMIEDKNLQALPKENTIKYGFYLLDDGLNYKYYHPINNGVVYFKGVDLHKYNQTWITRMRIKIRAATPPLLINIYRKIRHN